MTIGDRIKKRRLDLGMTADDLAELLGKSRATLYRYENGDIQKLPTTVLEPLAAALQTTPAYLLGWNSNDKKPQTTKGVRINVLGRVAAGVPIEAQQEIIDWEEISEEMAATGQFFALQIHGDSMLPRIQDGDVVIVRQQPDIDSGDVAIVMVNGSDATCKRVAKYSDGIRLIPNNPSYEPVFYSNEEIESKPVRVIGKVVELRGKF